MSNNCYISKLSGSVNNNNLDVYDKIFVNVSNANNRVWGISFKDNSTPYSHVIDIDGVSFSNTTGGNYLKFSGTGTFVIKDKYKLKYLEFKDFFKFQYIKNCPIETIDISNDTFPEGFTSLRQLAHYNLITLSVTSTSNLLQGNLQDLTGSKATLTTLNLKNYHKTTDFASLGDFVSLSTIGDMAGSYVSGSIENFVLNARSASRNSGSVTIQNCQYANVTFNDVKISTYTTGNNAFAWQPNSSVSDNTDITFNSVTITVDQQGQVVV